jgi:hypothetical protein
VSVSSLSGRLRTPRYVGLIGGLSVASVLLACCFLLINELNAAVEHAIEHPANPLSDAESEAQVLGPAKQIGSIADLQGVSGGYTLMSCKNEIDPPYQGAVLMYFDLPSDAFGYYQKIAAEMVARGWTERMSPNRNMPGQMLSKEGVTAIFGRDTDHIRLGTAKLYGECRDITDHRRETTAWVDITDQLH